MKRRSIRFRLTAWYAAILAGTLAVGGIGVWLAIRDSINDTVDKELRSRLHAMRDFIQHQTSDAEALADELTENAALAPAGTQFRIATAGGAWLYQSPGTQDWSAVPPDISHLSKRGNFETISQNGKPVRVLSAAIPSGIVQIGIPLDEFAEMLSAFSWTAMLGSPLLLILASAGGYLMSRRALAPVERIARTAGEIEARSLSERLPVRGTDDELDRLSGTLNAMLGRLEQSFRRITQFTADASHELRTPVAIIRITAEVIRKKSRTEKEYAEALDRILAESERTTELIEDLMLLARADANIEDMVLEPVALCEVARTACTDARVFWLTTLAGITLAFEQLGKCSVAGDHRAVRRLDTDPLWITRSSTLARARRFGSPSTHAQEEIVHWLSSRFRITASESPPRICLTSLSVFTAPQKTAPARLAGSGSVSRSPNRLRNATAVRFKSRANQAKGRLPG